MDDEYLAEASDFLFHDDEETDSMNQSFLSDNIVDYRNLQKTYGLDDQRNMDSLEMEVHLDEGAVYVEDGRVEVQATPGTLLAEHRRDLVRYLAGHTQEKPNVPLAEVREEFDDWKPVEIEYNDGSPKR